MNWIINLTPGMRFGAGVDGITEEVRDLGKDNRVARKPDEIVIPIPNQK